MSYKSILAIVGVDQDARDLQVAVELCRELDAHLSVVVAQLAPPPPMGDAGIIATVWLEQSRAEQDRLEADVVRLNMLLSQTGISFSAEGMFGPMANAGDDLGERARYSDLTIIGAALKFDPDLKSRAVDGCLFNSARPILLMPETGTASLRPKTVMIAWDSSLEAARAVGAALDLIIQAETVHVVLVDPKAATRENGEEPGADIARYLARYSDAVSIDRIPSMGRPVAEVLQQHAADISAGVVVMGAYGHSRIRERIFGGATRSMIEGVAVPVFMVH
ncbi:universal stress protein [Pararhizobium antarcticum]|uniref:Universal stress protein n=1 Tax=Pararhizobium antarcticum TaxID=1798805 RepID=A0A657LRS6_9HYPH|nr:universal stress protein [Pararhizobium antarcticum]OJF92758.1 universal stress protein [Rhizobium sp. 58]OJF95120.1 universal stress protein [Pararhizobium antarcticum]